MAIAKECDRCGTYYKNTKEPIISIATKITCKSPYLTIRDLCPECTRQISAWWNKFKHNERNLHER